MESSQRYNYGTGYVPKYEIGDRVRGTWNGIPFIGSVAIDQKVSVHEPPYVVVFSDLPIKSGDKYVRIIVVDHENIGPYK